MGTPSPEVTELICLVPEQTITRAPENTLSRPPVSVCGTDTIVLLSGFSWQTAGRISLSQPRFTSGLKPLRTGAYALRPRIGLDRTSVVTEC